MKNTKKKPLYRIEFRKESVDAYPRAAQIKAWKEYHKLKNTVGKVAKDYDDLRSLVRQARRHAKSVLDKGIEYVLVERDSFQRRNGSFGSHSFSDSYAFSNMPRREYYSNALSYIRRSISDDRIARRRLRERAGSIYDNATDTSISYRTIGGVFPEPNYILRLVKRKKSVTLQQYKSPTTDAPHMGIEIECLTPSSVDREKLLEELVPYGEYVSIDDDGSLRPDIRGEHTHEVKIMCQELDLGRVVTGVCDVLNRLNASVNKSCGLHVHIDARNRNPEAMFNKLRSVQSLMFSLVPLSRRKNKFCRRVKSGYGARRPDRYYAINSQSYERHKTLEVRLHSGTVRASKILNWCFFLINVVEAPLSPKPLKTVRSLCRHIPALKLIRTYLLSRQKQFRKNDSPKEAPVQTETGITRLDQQTLYRYASLLTERIEAAPRVDIAPPPPDTRPFDVDICSCSDCVTRREQEDAA